MEDALETFRPKGFLWMCLLFLVLAAYSLAVPLWKYSSYSFLAFVALNGLIVAMVARKGYRIPGVVVFIFAVLLIVETFNERKAFAAKHENLRKKAESRMVEELSKEKPATSEQATR